MLIGERLREVRQAQRLSLTEVAGRAGISAATLSRIETSKQGIGLSLFLSLANILKTEANELLTEPPASNGSEPLVRKIVALGAEERCRLWQDLAAVRRSPARSTRSDLTQRVEELLAQFEYLKQEMEAVRSSLKRG